MVLFSSARGVTFVVVVALCVLPFVFCEEGRLLRRRRGRPGDFAPKVAQAECLSNTMHYFLMIGERTLTDGNFIAHNPDLPQHRQIMGYTEEDVAKYWADAMAFTKRATGVDFSEVQWNEEAGMYIMDGFVMFSVTLNFGLNLQATTTLGTLDCPLTFGDEAIIMVPTALGTYHGTYGGEEGVPAYAGEVSTAWGHYMMDLDKDGDIEIIQYWTNSVMRVVHGSVHLDCDMLSEEYGMGRNEGQINIGGGPGGVLDDGNIHGFVRGLGTFPSGWDYGVQHKNAANNWGEQWSPTSG